MVLTVIIDSYYVESYTRFYQVSEPFIGVTLHFTGLHSWLHFIYKIQKLRNAIRVFRMHIIVYQKVYNLANSVPMKTVCRILLKTVLNAIS